VTQPQKRTILVFGATGGTGAGIVRAALARACSVTVFVRSSNRARNVFDDLLPELNIIKGDACNEADVMRAIDPSLDAVICSLGIYQRSAGRDDLARATRHIVAAMQATGVRRLVCVSSLGVGDSRGQGDFATRLIQKTGLRFTLADKELQEQAIRDSGLDWTIIRPTRLLHEGGPPYYQWWIGAQPSRKMHWAINRSQVAELALDCIEDARSIGKALNVTGSLSMPQNAG